MLTPSIREEGRIGSGNWDAFPHERIFQVYKAAEKWADQLKNIKKPWLCWCLSNQWCILQQRLVHYVGWTPVIGNDTTINDPTVLDGSVYVDFNQELKLPRLHRCFPLEWIFLFTDKLAFWHSDLLLTKKDMEKTAQCFEDLQQGGIAMDWINGSSFLMRTIRRMLPIGNKNRLFEVLGCNTRTASKYQYENGLGFWRHPEKHPNNVTLPPNYPHWEHSIGVSLWIKKNPKNHKSIGVNTAQGHASSWNISKKERRDISKQELLERHEDILYYAKKLRIDDLLI